MLIELLANPTALRKAIAVKRARAFAPTPDVTADEWADTYRVVPSETSAVTGRWDTSMYEVARGPMRAITEPGVRIISGAASAQIFKTSTGETAIGYFMHLNPRPILVYQPTDTSVAAFVDAKLDPMIKSSPVLAQLWGGRAALERKNDKFVHAKKTFAGGYVEILTANSPSNTASRSAGVVFMDEIDKFELTRDGDAVALIDERLKGFTGEELSIRMSTPTIEGESPIAAEYQKSDMRKPYVECPNCSEWHYFKFEHVHYKDARNKADPSIAAYNCESCGVDWTEAERVKALTTKDAISWRQTKPFRCCDEKQHPEIERLWEHDGHVERAICKHCGTRAVVNRHAGFWAWELYHPRRSCEDLIRAWLDCAGNKGKMQNFINSKLAETWKVQQEDSADIDPEQFAARVEPTWDLLPSDIHLLTMGVDVQPRGTKSTGRIEFEIVGWGSGEETWSVAYHIIEGDPDDGAVWSALDDIRKAAYATTDGRQLRVQAACIDTGGHNIDAVMSYAAARKRERVWAIKGASEQNGNRNPIWPIIAPKTIRNGAKLFIIGTSAAKDWVASCVAKTQAGPGYMHVGSDRDESWFAQMLNEKRVSFMHNGRSRTSWRVRASGARTEALDCRVYAKAALEGLKRAGFKTGVHTAAEIAAPAPAPAPADQEEVSSATTTEAAPQQQPRIRRPKKRRPPVTRSNSFW
jgi:phage terminase large subunit GpA-like protein